MLQVPQRSQHEPGADAEDDRERNLRGHERAKRAPPCRRFRALRLTKQRLQLGPGGDDHRDEREQHRDGDRRREHRREDDAVERDLALPRNLRRHGAHEERQRRYARAASRRQRQVPPAPPARSPVAARAATRDAPRAVRTASSRDARDGAAEHERAEVDRRQQQDQPDRRQQDHERRTDVTDDDVLERRDADGASPVRRASTGPVAWPAGAPATPRNPCRSSRPDARARTPGRTALCSSTPMPRSGAAPRCRCRVRGIRR